MRLIIAEKPSMAKAIREAIKDKVVVTNCVGHLLEPAPPSDYDEKWKYWNVSTLPIKVTHWKLLPKNQTSAQLDRVVSLIKQAHEVIHAGDPDREGQLLVDEVLDYAGWAGPTKRMLITDLRPESIRKSWADLKDNADFQPLRKAAECRQRADWLVGMNMTRAATKLLSRGSLITVGRVQTPTLALVVARHKAIANFSADTFFTLRATANLAGNRTINLECKPAERILDRQLAKTLAKEVKGQTVALSVTENAQTRGAPMPFRLGTFQTAAEHHFGWSLDKALASLQKAYEALWISYPRSDCSFLPEEHKKDAVNIGLTVAAALGVPKSLTGAFAPNPKVYNSKKTKAHHGIVPTGAMPSPSADPDARKAWELVCLHYLLTLLPDERYTKLQVKTEVATAERAPYNRLVFAASAERPATGIHWRMLDLDAIHPPRRGRAKAGKEATAPQAISGINDGDSARLDPCSPHQGKTTPPKPYTQASLRADMEGVAKFATNEKMKAILKETEGIGTAATQASIVKRLIDRGFVTESKDGKLDAAKIGVEMIDILPTQLADPVMTAAWEMALSKMADGEYEESEFMARVAGLVDRQLAKLQEKSASGYKIGTKSTQTATKPRPVKSKKKKGNARSSKVKKQKNDPLFI